MEPPVAESQSHHSQSNFVVLLFLVFIISFFVWHTVVQWPVILTSDTVLLASTNPGAETVRYHVPLFFILLFVSVGFYFLCPSLFFIVFFCFAMHHDVVSSNFKVPQQRLTHCLGLKANLSGSQWRSKRPPSEP